jgi:hypothetical protein
MPVRFRRIRGKRTKPPGGFCVDRGSRFGNRAAEPEPYGDPAAHAVAVAQDRKWITSPEQAELLATARRELRGHDLGCYCRLDLPCHADVLLELVN